MYILDTDHVSLFQRQLPQVLNNIYANQAEEIAVTIVTLEEQMRGRLDIIRKASSKDGLTGAYARLNLTFNYFKSVNLLDFTNIAYDEYKKLEQQKIRIGTRDLRIASIALSLNSIVVTRNTKDFSKIPNLKLEDWTIE